MDPIHYWLEIMNPILHVLAFALRYMMKSAKDAAAP